MINRQACLISYYFLTKTIRKSLKLLNIATFYMITRNPSEIKALSLFLKISPFYAWITILSHNFKYDNGRYPSLPLLLILTVKWSCFSNPALLEVIHSDHGQVKHIHIEWTSFDHPPRILNLHSVASYSNLRETQV